MQKILLTYASKYGSTAEIAAAIGNTLSEAGLQVKVVSVDAVHDLQDYDAVVIGSAVYAGNWLANGVKFVERFEGDLAQKPVWIFSSGPTGVGSADELLDGWHAPESIQPILERIQPQDIHVFHGKIDVEKLHWGERMLVRAMRGATGDFRDWDEIRQWASDISHILMPA